MAISSKSDRFSVINIRGRRVLPEPSAEGIQLADRSMLAGLYARTFFVEVYPTGVGGTGGVGDLSVTGPAVHQLTGVSGTGGVGAFSFLLQPVNDRGGYINLRSSWRRVLPVANNELDVDDRMQLLGAARNINTDSQSVTLTGVNGTAQIGAIAVTEQAAAVPESVSGTGQIGSFSITTHAASTPASVFGVATVGTLSHNITGASLWWNGSWWNSAWWNAEWWNKEGGVSTFPSGVNATASVGTFTIGTGTIHQITGTQGLGQVGGLSVAAGTSVSTGISSVSSIGQIGDLAIIGGASFSPPGVAGTGAVGTITTNIGFLLSGIQAVAAVGDFTVNTHGTTTITGVAGVGGVGAVTATGYASVPAYPSEDRIVVIPAEDRILVVPAEDRILTVR